MKKTNVTGYSFDPITNVVTCSESFLKKASRLNSSEYLVLKQFRAEIPGLKIEKGERKSGNRPLNITFAKMEEYIKNCRDGETRLEAFQKVKSLSKIQSSPYQYVRTWFLDNYANYSEQTTFDADGFVVVKTKSQMEAEKKAAVEAQEQSFEEVMAEAKAQFEETAA